MGAVKELAISHGIDSRNVYFDFLKQQELPTHEKIKHAIGWQWQAPDLNPYTESEIRALLATEGDPTLSRAWEFAKQGPAALAGVVTSSDHQLIALLLEIQERFLPHPEHVCERRQQWAITKSKEIQKTATDDLLRQATGLEPVMVGKFSHFDGEYPEGTEKGHVCRSHWVAKGQGEQITSLARVRFELWRPLVTRSGEILHCQQCEHERIQAFCELIERVSLYYEQAEHLRYLIVNSRDYSKLAAALRQERKRYNNDVTLTSFPIETGLTLILHDAASLEWSQSAMQRKWVRRLLTESKALPTDRAELYKLFSIWHRPPKGKRSGHGLETWSREGPSGMRPEGEGAEQKNGKGRKGQRTKPAGKQATGHYRIVGINYGYVMRLIARLIGRAPSAQGMRFNGELDTADFLNLLDATGLAYSIEGELPEAVTLSRYRYKNMCAKRDNHPLQEAPTIVRQIFLDESPESEWRF